MVPSSKLSFIANDNNPTDIDPAPGSTIHFSSLELLTDCFGHLSFSPQRRDSGGMFIGMVHNGSPSKRTPLKEYSNENGATSDAGGAWDPPAPKDATW
jgi:hypothetical protein